MNYNNLVKLIIFSLSFSLISSFLKGENLEEIYELALKNDPLLKAAEATYRAGKENKAQGRAGLLPTLSISGSSNWNEYRVLDQIIDGLVSFLFRGKFFALFSFLFGLSFFIQMDNSSKRGLNFGGRFSTKADSPSDDSSFSNN